MKSHLPLVAVAFVLVLLLTMGIGAALVTWERSQQLPDTPETKSAFLKNYTPESVIRPYLCNQSYSYNSGGGGGGVDNKSVSHTADFEWHFSMRSDKQPVLMEALNHDLSAQLMKNGAEILSRGGDAVGGFHYRYKLHNNLGTATISPITLGHVQRNLPLPAGVVDVNAQVVLTEEWFPKEATAIETSLKPVQ
jgi:hypothetical protein